MNEAEKKALIEIADAVEDLCDLWTYPLDDMDPRLLAARELMRAADIAYRRLTGKPNKRLRADLYEAGMKNKERV